MTATALAAREELTTPVRGEKRPEIQALRALAVMAVVLNHLWPEQVRGGFVGVDIFFVISGYLITAHLLREVRSTGRIALAAFWARRARRLLPASLLVLLVAMLGTLAFVPATLWQGIGRQILASAFYVQNWALSADAVDYFASLNSASPVTHFWSLSVEEQFYIFWPLAILAAVVLLRRPLSPVMRVAIVLAVIVAASFAVSIVATLQNPNTAYFNTLARAWEFGVGGLLAVVGARVAGRRRATATAWAGWGLLDVSLIVLSPATPFPGYAALLPVLGTALVLVGGDPRGAWAPGQLTSFGPVQAIGDISYSLYLWHWPLIILFPFVMNRQPGNLWLLAILIISIVLAYLSKRFVEDTTRSTRLLARARPRRTLFASLAAMVVVGLVSGGAWWNVETRSETAQAAIDAAISSDEPCFGGSDGPDCTPVHTLTDGDFTLAASRDLSNEVQDGDVCTQTRESSGIVTCAFGASEEDAKVTVALTGDSHAGHWIGAVNEIAKENDWRVELFIKSSCPTTSSTTVQAAWYALGAPSCHEWGPAVVERIAADPNIDLVITSAIGREYIDPTRGRGAGMNPEDFRAAWNTWIAAGKSVVAIADTPRFDLGDLPTCVARAGGADPCTKPATDALPGDAIVAAASGMGSDDFRLADVNDAICTDDLCHPVVGGLMTFGDGNHMTYSFSRTIAGLLWQQIEDLPALN